MTPRKDGMKRLVVAATGLLAVLAFAPSALADTPDCVTRAEYRAVHTEDSIRRVHRVFDIRGRRLWIDGEGDYKTQKRRYRTCRAHSSVTLWFNLEPGVIWFLVHKEASWS
jgi:hypothetical protein